MADRQNLKTRLELIHAEYRANFSGRPRVTRSLSEIRDLVEQLEQLENEAAGLVGTGTYELMVLLRERLDLYRRERDAIRDAQTQGPNAVKAAVFSMRAGSLFAQYRRWYAKKARSSRSLWLLDDIVSDLHAIRTAVRELVNDGAKVQQLSDLNEHLELYERERRTIETAIRSSDDRSRSASLAKRANLTFGLYRGLVGGRPRLACRPEMLASLVSELAMILGSMRSLVDVDNVDQTILERNIELVEQRLLDYREELQRVREAVGRAPASRRLAMLGRTTNQVIDSYREGYAGKKRLDSNLEELGKLCDCLIELERQMLGLADQLLESGDTQLFEANARNLNVVRDNLALYEHEYRLIEEAQASHSSGN